MPFGISDSTLKIVIDAENRARAAMNEAMGQIDKVKGKLQKMQPAFKKMAMYGTAAFGAIAAGVVLTTKEAGIAEGAWNKFNTVFGEGAEEMSDWVDELRKDMPTATHEIVRMAAGLQDLLIPMGFSREEGMKLTQQSLELANQIAAFNDVDPTEVLEAMKSGFTGMSEPLRRFGIDARITALEATAQKEGLMGLEETFNDLDPAMRQNVQAQALMIQMTNQSADAIEGFAVNQDSYLRRSQEMAARTLETKKAIGDALLPVLDDLLKKILPVIEKIGEWIKENPELTKKIIIATGAIAGLVAVIGGLGLILPHIITGLGFLLSPIGIITVSILALAAAAVWLYTKWDEMGSVIRSVIAALLGPFGMIVAIAKTFQERWAETRDFFIDLWNDMKEIWGNAIDWIMNKLQPLINAIETIRTGAGTIKGAIGGAMGTARGLLPFQEGGIVPGPIGAPIPALVHGGETIIPSGKGIGGITINIYGDVTGEEIIDKVGRGLINRIKREKRIL